MCFCICEVSFSTSPTRHMRMMDKNVQMSPLAKACSALSLAQCRHTLRVGALLCSMSFSNSCRMALWLAKQGLPVERSANAADVEPTVIVISNLALYASLWLPSRRLLVNLAVETHNVSHGCQELSKVSAYVSTNLGIL